MKTPRLIAAAALATAMSLAAGCEYDADPTTQYGPETTTGEPFMFESKPVGDPSREPYGPEHVGSRIAIPAGPAEGPAAPDSGNVQTPARNGINP